LRRAAGLLALILALTTAATAVRGQTGPVSPKSITPAPEPVAEIVAQLVVAGDVSKPLSLSSDDLRHLPRTTITVTNEHLGNNKEVYGGVLLSVLLKQAGAPQLRGPAMADYVSAEGVEESGRLTGHLACLAREQIGCCVKFGWDFARMRFSWTQSIGEYVSTSSYELPRKVTCVTAMDRFPALPWLVRGFHNGT
jgi:DMSO/TMAO reductase YedYZ molybdopterin-dependent catalytic subunit